MPIKTSDGTQVSNMLVLALQRCIVETFNEAKWTELGYATDTAEIIDSTYRLRRSLAWGDEDYPERVFAALERIIEEPDPPVLREVVEFVGLEDWLEASDPGLYVELFGDVPELALVDSIDDSEVVTIPELMRHSRRIRHGLESDPEQAIGSAKELLETVMKSVLGDPDSHDDIPELVKRTRTELGIDTRDPTVKRLTSNLSQVVVGVAEMRNNQGTGHGRVGSVPPELSYARLAVDSSLALSRFFLGLHVSRSAK
jgi:hypothetical protein